MGPLKTIARMFAVIASSTWLTVIALLDWIGRGLVLAEVVENAPPWVAWILEEAGFAPWWIPAALLAAALIWGILHDVSLVRQARKLDDIEIDGGTF